MTSGLEEGGGHTVFFGNSDLKPLGIDRAAKSCAAGRA